jgi:hypothetical protein
MARTYPRILPEAEPIYANDIVISDAGVSDLNGTYIYMGFSEGKAFYYKTTKDYYILWDSANTRWVIGAYAYYYSTEDVATPDLVTTWVLGTSGSTPLPTVSTTQGTTLLGYTQVEFSEEDIREATVVEEFNPLSIVLPVNRLEVLLYSENADFSILNPSGDYASLVHRTPMMVYQVNDGAQMVIGQYYLDEWENVSDTLIRLNLMDEMGILDSLTYKGGIWLTPTTLGDLLQEMFSGIDSEYELDPNLEDEEVSGWIPICSYREALQQIAFAVGAYVLCARQDGFIKIGTTEAAGALTKGIRSGVAGAGQSRIYQKRWRVSQWEGVDPTYTITEGEQSIGTPVNLRTQVTGIELSMHDIVEGTGEKTLFEGTLAAGDHEINFSQPMHDLRVTGATISESGANYAILTVASEGSVELIGQVYVDTVTRYGVYMSNPTSVKENVLKITDASLVNSNNGAAIAQSIYDYYQQRHVISPKLYATYIEPGASVLVDTLYSQQISGVVEKMDADLANGFISKVTIVGELSGTS